MLRQVLKFFWSTCNDGHSENEKTLQKRCILFRFQILWRNPPPVRWTLLFLASTNQRNHRPFKLTFDRLKRPDLHLTSVQPTLLPLSWQPWHLEQIIRHSHVIRPTTERRSFSHTSEFHKVFLHHRDEGNSPHPAGIGLIAFSVRKPTADGKNLRFCSEEETLILLGRRGRVGQ
jgi:hypothetical protein